MTVQSLLQQAVEHHRAGRLREAEEVYRQVLAADPNQPDALHLLGMVALQAGKVDYAITLIRRAMDLQPAVVDYPYNLGVALMMAQRIEPAAEAFGRAVSLRPDFFAARSNLAAAWLSLGQYEKAIEASKAALALDPDHGQTLNNYGVALKELRRWDEAVEILERAVRQSPDSVEALTNLGNALQLKGEYTRAIEAHQRAIALRPDVPELHNNLGSTLYEQLEYERAIESYTRALELRPNYPEATCTLANCYYRLGRLEEGIRFGRRAIELWPDAPLPKFNLGLMLLSAGQFAEGWRLNEARWDIPRLKNPRPSLPKQRWDGSNLNGRRILLYAEQGFGDTIQFVRYVPLVQQRGGRVILGCQNELLRLLERMEGVERAISRVDKSVDFDVHCPLMSLPLVFGTDETNIPVFEKYIVPDPKLVERWGERMGTPGGDFRIGLAWAGRPSHENDRNRSMQLSQLAPLLAGSDARFYSLQKGQAAQEAATEPRLVDLSGDVQDFADTAAIIANLDLVICVDTAVAHLAAAMGKPTWVLLAYAPDWRWLYGRDDSPWYPTMRLFRQPRPRAWEPVIKAVRESMQSLIHAHRR